MLSINFSTDNDAFNNGCKELEISRILHNLAIRIANGDCRGNVQDINGNTIGKFEVR